MLKYVQFVAHLMVYNVVSWKWLNVWKMSKKTKVSFLVNPLWQHILRIYFFLLINQVFVQTNRLINKRLSFLQRILHFMPKILSRLPSSYTKVWVVAEVFRAALYNAARNVHVLDTQLYKSGNRLGSDGFGYRNSDRTHKTLQKSSSFQNVYNKVLITF